MYNDFMQCSEFGPLTVIYEGEKTTDILTCHISPYHQSCHFLVLGTIRNACGGKSLKQMLLDYAFLLTYVSTKVGVDFLSVDGKTISSSSIPYMLRFRSGPIRQILFILKIAPLMTGYSTETQTLNVKMKDFIEQHEPTSCVKVTLERRAEVQPGSGIPELYDAHLVLESKLTFFKRITWHWKKTVFLWITMMAFMIESLFLLVCCRSKIIPIKRQSDCSGCRCSTDKQS